MGSVVLLRTELRTRLSTPPKPPDRMLSLCHFRLTFSSPQPNPPHPPKPPDPPDPPDLWALSLLRSSEAKTSHHHPPQTAGLILFHAMRVCVTSLPRSYPPSLISAAAWLAGFNLCSDERRLTPDPRETSTARSKRLRSSIALAPSPCFAGCYFRRLFHSTVSTSHLSGDPHFFHRHVFPIGLEMGQTLNFKLVGLMGQIHYFQKLGFISLIILKDPPHIAIRLEKSTGLEAETSSVFTDMDSGVLPTYRRISEFASAVLEYCQLTSVSPNLLFSLMENVFKRSALKASRAISVVRSSLLAEELRIVFKAIILEALSKKLPVFISDLNCITYPFNALSFISVTSSHYFSARSLLLLGVIV